MLGLKTFWEHGRVVKLDRRAVYAIFALQFLSVLFEGIGISMFLPVMQYIRSDGDITALTAESSLWQYLTDAFAVVHMPVTLASLLTVSFLMFLLRQFFLYVRMVYTNKVKFDLMRTVRHDAFEAYLKAKMGYHDKLSAGRFVNELTTETQTGIGGLMAYISFVGFIIMAVVYVGWMLVFSAEMTLYAALIFALAGTGLATLLRRSRIAGKHVFSINQDVGQFLLERLRNSRLVRLANMEDAETTEMHRLTRLQRDNQVHLTRVRALTQVLAEPLVLVGVFVLLYVSVTLLQQPLEFILLFFLIVLRLMPVMKEILIRRQAFVSSLASLEAVIDRLTELRAAAEESPGRGEPGRIGQEIAFENVSFSYDGEAGKDVPAIRDVSLTIPAGTTTAIVGPSGAGKSTLIDLIPRLREPQTGRILVDGRDTRDLDLGALRRMVGFAPQDPLILDVPVADHIRYGNPDASDAEVAQAATLANAHDFIEQLPDGYRTRLGESGKFLSGGQRQRLDLARTLASQAPLLILDEPTSNLDEGSVARFNDALRRIRAETDRTIIIIAHRLPDPALIDQIVVLENGSVRSVGTHDALYEHDDWYRDVYAQQSATPRKTGRTAQDTTEPAYEQG